MNAEELMALNEQIASMARAGLPLDQGLASLAREMGRGRLRHVTDAIADDLRRGRTLPEALDLRRDQLPPYYSALATAGIRTGRLPEVLCTMTEYSRAIAVTRTMIIEALAYPAMIFGFGIMVLLFLAMYVVPQFEVIFRDFRLPLPALTELVMLLSKHPFEWLVIPAVTVFVLIIAVRFISRCTPVGRRIWTHIVYSVPLIGSLIQSARRAAFTDLLGVLIKYEVPLPEAFRLAGDACSDPLLADQSQEMTQRLQGGMTLGDALASGRLLPEWVAWMAKSGERRGDLAETLRQVANVYRRQVEARIGVLRNMLPALFLIIVSGFLMIVFIGSLLAPLISLIEGLSK
jgi:general secretion pathway protein F